MVDDQEIPPQSPQVRARTLGPIGEDESTREYPGYWSEPSEAEPEFIDDEGAEGGDDADFELDGGRRRSRLQPLLSSIDSRF